MGAEAAVKAQKTLDTKRRQQERHRQPKRIQCQQKYALAHRILRRSESENHAQDRADAGCPAKCECKSNQKRAHRSAATFKAMQSCVGVQRFDFEYASQV